MVLNKLSARQIKMIDEVATERQTNKNTLDVALQFHSNRAIEIERDNRKIWDELTTQFGLSTTDGEVYKISKIDGVVCIVPKEKDDE